MTEARHKPPQRLVIWLDLLLNVILPAIILNKFSRSDRLGPVWALVVALVLPLAYGWWTLKRQKKFSFWSILGIVGLLLTGGIGLLKLPTGWLAVKEAAIPLTFGLAILISLKTKFPIVHKMVYNDQVMQTRKVADALAARGRSAELLKLLRRASYGLAATFFGSAILNFILAKVIVQSQSGTPEFAAELGRLTAVSYPAIALPSMIALIAVVWRLVTRLSRLTGLKIEEIFRIDIKN